MASYDLKAILGEKLKRLTEKTLKALVDCMCTVGASLCSLDKRVSALESVELPEGGYKPMQEPVASPSASGTAIQFIDSMSQDATGRMTATKKTVRTGSTSQTGVLQLKGSIAASESDDSKAATPKAVRDAINALDAEVTSSDGTNVQVKVTEVDGKISAVNVTTDITESKANKTTFIRDYDSASDPASDDRYPSEKAVAQQLYGVGNKPMLHAEGYYNLSYGSTTWRNVGLYVNDSDTPVAQPNIYGPEGDRIGRLTGGLDSLLHETGWEPYTDYGCLDYTAIFDMVTTSTIDLDLQMVHIIAHGIRKFKYRFFNYGQGLVRVRFCYSKTGGTYDDGLEIFTQEGKSTLKYYQVDVPASRYAEAEVVIPSTIHAETNSWVALMRVTNGVT